ncbi:MAG: hypothetical protein RL557_860, partial [archaeon]
MKFTAMYLKLFSLFFLLHHTQMVFKRYIKRGGKLFGPYYYESYRDEKGVVRKKYIGTDLPVRRTAPRNVYLFILFGILLCTFLFFFFSNKGGVTLFHISLSKISGYVVSSLAEETVVEQFDNVIDLEIIEPLTLNGEAVGTNKNERMDFDVEGGLRLYFNVLDYDTYVDQIAEKSLKQAANKTSEEIIPEESFSQDESEENLPPVEEEPDDTIDDDIVVQPVPIEEDRGQEENLQEGSKDKDTSEDEPTSNSSGESNPEESSQSDSVLETQPVEEEEAEVEEEPSREVVQSSDNKDELAQESRGENEIAAEPESSAPITGNFMRFFGLVGRVIGVEEEEAADDLAEDTGALEESNEAKKTFEEISLETLQQTIEELNKEELDVIEENSVVEMDEDEFVIALNESAAQEHDVDYKWAYNVALKDYHFLASITVTSEEEMGMYDETSLKIGNTLLSFQDLVDAGYTVRFEKPLITSVGKEVEKKEIEIIEINQTEKSAEDTPTEIEDEELLEIPVETPETSGESVVQPEIPQENLAEENETEQGVEENASNSLGTQPVEGDAGEGELENDSEEVPEETLDSGENEISEAVVQPSESVETPEENIPTEITKTETQESEPVESDSSVETGELAPITGNFARFFGLVGRAIGVDEPLVEDEYYEHTMAVYIERDFSEAYTSDKLVIGKDFEDIDGNGELNVGDIIILDPSLKIIPLSNAIHLNEDRNFIRNIYNETKDRDDVWAFVNNSHYVRAHFQEPLGKHNDITVYARMLNYTEDSSSATIEIYKENSDENVALIENITTENFYSTLLTGLNDSEKYDTFYLKIVGNDSLSGIEFDYIVDPVTTPALEFVSPSPANATTTANFSVSFNTSIEIGNLSDVKWNWNGTNFSLYNQSVALLFNFDNRSVFGENDTRIVDFSTNQNNGTAYLGGRVNITNCKFGNCFTFDGNNDYINVSDSNSLDLTT